MDIELIREIIDLYHQNFTPQQIAPYLGIRVFEVVEVIKQQGGNLSLLEEDELSPLAKCLVNVNCARRLLDQTLVDQDVKSSLGLVLVSRYHDYSYYSICTYLVDYLCLGVKDTMGPRLVSHDRYHRFVESCYSYFEDGYTEITLEEAQAIVLGAVNYAMGLGFEPHVEFDYTYQHLGEWCQPLQLEFGLGGKPFYINGRYDNSRQIIKTLENNIGRGNFEYILGIG